MTEVQEKFFRKPLERQVKEYTAAIILEKYELLHHIRPLIKNPEEFDKKVDYYLNKYQNHGK